MTTAPRKGEVVRAHGYLLPTLKQSPADAKIASHQLMLRTGMIRQTSAGIYAWLPLGLRVLRLIEQIVRAEQDRFGIHEMLMPTIQSADLWQESGRYEDYGRELLRITDRHDRPMLYGPTNEEMITALARQALHSYKQLPLRVYHIQWKFRDEIRPRFGVMRGREFLMKDAYSFDLDAASARLSYNRFVACYVATFRRLGLTAVPVRADTGPIGGDLSHEFAILADTGESELHVDAALVDKIEKTEIPTDDAAITPWVADILQHYAAADDMRETDAPAKVAAEQEIISRRGIEVGHIFYFGNKYSAAMGAQVLGPDGRPQALEMGSYGIGVSRLVAALIEANHDDAGIVWPLAATPFHAAVLNIAGEEGAQVAQDISAHLAAQGADVYLDDRIERAGLKFADADLVGFPWQLIVSPRHLAKDQIELKWRATGERHVLARDAALAKVLESISH